MFSSKKQFLYDWRKKETHILENIICKCLFWKWTTPLTHNFITLFKKKHNILSSKTAPSSNLVPTARQTCRETDLTVSFWYASVLVQVQLKWRFWTKKETRCLGCLWLALLRNCWLSWKSSGTVSGIYYIIVCCQCMIIISCFLYACVGVCDIT